MDHFASDLPGLDFANVEFADEFAIFGNIPITQIRLEPSTLTNEEQQAATAMKILFVRAKMVGDLQNSILENRDLNLGRAGVAILGRVIRDHLSFELLIEWHRT
jgi:hypothetical protein